MRNIRSDILEWAENGRIKSERMDSALTVSAALPDAPAWRHFIEQMLLWIGVTLIASGVIFFLAYNWRALDRFVKFALVEGVIVGAVGLSWFYGLERPAGKAALLAASLISGALMALFGQTYQTGADPWELFANWALLILPWVLVARLPALWIIWLSLLNLAIVLYHQAFLGIFGLATSERSLLWSLFGLNSIALVVWEGCALKGVSWLRSRWAARLIATASGIAASTIALYSVFDAREMGPAALPAYLLWMGVAFWFYQFRMLDLYVLAAGILSLIVFIAAFLGRHLLSNGGASGFLFIGLVVIGLSAGGAMWLKKVATEANA
ncbi:MAG TPA: DUF2157 domain-containing protein [Burkholderiales bacterium]|nr:DUF2157 domain-containing protein [Burkholderiales bacterium]